MHIFIIILFAVLVVFLLLGGIQLMINIRQNTIKTGTSVNSSKNNSSNREKQYIHKIERLVKNHDLLNRTFYDYNTNPEILITKPLLIDVSAFTTEKMINDIVYANDFLNSHIITTVDDFVSNKSSDDIENFIDNFEYILNGTQQSIISADVHASKIGVSGLSSNEKRIATKSLSFVVNNASTKSEKKRHWENVIKIARNANIDEQTIAIMNSRVMDSIELGKTTPFKELI